MLRRIFIALLFFEISGAKKQNLICESGSISDEDESSNGNTIHVRGPEGSKGDKGDNGVSGRYGLSGQDASVDYNVISTMILQKIDEAFNSTILVLDQRLDKLEQRLSAITETTTAPTMSTLSPDEIKIAKFRAKGLCSVQYKNLFFWVVVQKRQSYYFSTAQTECEKNDGKVANIYSEEHMYDLMNVTRAKSPVKYDTTRVWTGMEVDPSTRELRLSDGSPAPYVGWYSSWLPEAGQRRVNLKVSDDPGSFYQGMASPVGRLYGTICEA